MGVRIAVLQCAGAEPIPSCRDEWRPRDVADASEPGAPATGQSIASETRAATESRPGWAVAVCSPAWSAAECGVTDGSPIRAPTGRRIRAGIRGVTEQAGVETGRRGNRPFGRGFPSPSTGVTVLVMRIRIPVLRGAALCPWLSRGAGSSLSGCKQGRSHRLVCFTSRHTHPSVGMAPGKKSPDPFSNQSAGAPSAGSVPNDCSAR